MVYRQSYSGKQGSKLRRFSCPQCNASFTRAAHLRRHQLTHLGEKPFFCAFCSMSSSRKDVIIRHTRKLHPNTSREPRNRESEPAESSRSSVRSPLCTPTGEGSSSRVPELTGSEARDIFSTSLPEVSQQNQHSSMSETIGERVMDELPFNSFAFSTDGIPLLDALTPTTSRLLDSFCQSQAHGGNEGAQFHGTQLSNLIPANEAAIGVAPSNNRSQSQQKAPNNQPFSLNDEDYANAKANLSLSMLCRKPVDDWFPSKYTVIRFVKSFFDNMAPHMPIVHGLTFRVATVAPPLLLQVMACGAVYLGERGIADEMHEIAFQAVMQDQLLLFSAEQKGKFELWVLQALLLINVYHACSTQLLMEQQEIYLFSHIIRLASRALREPQTSPSDYQQWVYEETISRCISYTIFLGAIYISTTTDGSFALQFLDGSFPLPSNTPAWLSAEDWKDSAPDRLEYSATLHSILSGQRPLSDPSGLGLLTIVSAILCRICLFGNLYFQQPDIYRVFVSQMEQPLQVLHDIWTEHNTKCPTPDSVFEPLTRCVHAALHSAYYHLYGYQALKLMKKYLYSPESLVSLTCFAETLNDQYIEKCLMMATSAWRDDCREGLGYLERFAPYRYSALLATSVSERALILLWYYATRPLIQLPSEQHLILENLTMQVISELRGSSADRTGEVAILPLITYMKCLKEDTVWLFPSIIAGKMKRLIEQIEFLSSIGEQVPRAQGTNTDSGLEIA